MTRPRRRTEAAAGTTRRKGEPDGAAVEERRFRRVFRRAHAGHAGCLEDEWLMEPCRLASGEPAPRPVVWSRRNGPWRSSPILWVGAAPGNAGGKGGGPLGAHGTLIPFGGDVAGANLDVLMGSVGTDRNRTFIAAALNQLPARGGGEPGWPEILAPAGDYPSSLHLLRDTIVAVGPRLLVALGNVALRASVAAARLEHEPERGPGLRRLERAGLRRGHVAGWPAELAPDAGFLAAWDAAWKSAPIPHLLWLLHPSAQNMSPYAGTHTVFHTRMLETRDALRRAARRVLDVRPPEPRPDPPDTGIYALPEWRERVGPRHAALDRLWRAKGV